MVSNGQHRDQKGRAARYQEDPPPKLDPVGEGFEPSVHDDPCGWPGEGVGDEYETHEFGGQHGEHAAHGSAQRLADADLPDPAPDRVGDQREEAQACEQHPDHRENREDVADALLGPVHPVDILVDKGKGEGEIGKMPRPGLFNERQRSHRVLGLDTNRDELSTAVKDHEGFDGQVQ